MLGSIFVIFVVIIITTTTASTKTITITSIAATSSHSHSTSPLPQVCPASWRPGQATMKPDPKGSQEFFKTLPQ